MQIPLRYRIVIPLLHDTERASGAKKKKKSRVAVTTTKERALGDHEDDAAKKKNQEALGRWGRKEKKKELGGSNETKITTGMWSEC